MADGIERKGVRIGPCRRGIVTEEEPDLEQGLKNLLQVGDANLGVFLQMTNGEARLTIVLQQYCHLADDTQARQADENSHCKLRHMARYMCKYLIFYTLFIYYENVCM